MQVTGVSLSLEMPSTGRASPLLVALGSLLSYFAVAFYVWALVYSARVVPLIVKPIQPPVIFLAVNISAGIASITMVACGRFLFFLLVRHILASNIFKLKTLGRVHHRMHCNGPMDGDTSLQHFASRAEIRALP
jgi:hypothetical protein